MYVEQNLQQQTITLYVETFLSVLHIQCEKFQITSTMSYHRLDGKSVWFSFSEPYYNVLISIIVDFLYLF